MVWRHQSREMTNVLLSVVAIALFGSISTVFGQVTSKPSSMPTAEQLAKADITFKVISVDKGYGYDVYVDGKKLIHQPNIPGRPGMAGFTKKEDSQRVAELVVRKLKNNQIPPAITEEELRQIKFIEY
jgi:hypothetical protein